MRANISINESKTESNGLSLPALQFKQKQIETITGHRENMHSLVAAVRASVMSSRPWSSQSERLGAATGSSTETHKEKIPSTPHDRDSLHKPRIDFEIYVFIKTSSKRQRSLKTIVRHKCNVACEFQFSNTHV